MNTTENTKVTAAAEEAAAALAAGKQVWTVDLCPGNGTRYLMVLACTDDAGDAAAMIGGVEDRHVLSLPYFGTSYPVNLPGYFTTGYATEKWTQSRASDGEVVADFLNTLSTIMKEN